MNKSVTHTNSFNPISLSEMDGVKLMNRSDTKFTFRADKLPSLFENLIPFYNVLEIDGKRIHSYKSLYFDTNDRKFYKDHFDIVKGSRARAIDDFAMIDLARIIIDVDVIDNRSVNNAKNIAIWITLSGFANSF